MSRLSWGIRRPSGSAPWEARRPTRRCSWPAAASWPTTRVRIRDRAGDLVRACVMVLDHVGNSRCSLLCALSLGLLLSVSRIPHRRLVANPFGHRDRLYYGGAVVSLRHATRVDRDERGELGEETVVERDP